MEWMDLEKNYPKRGSPDPERKIWNLFTYMWILTVKSLTTKLQSTEPQRLGIE